MADSHLKLELSACEDNESNSLCDKLRVTNLSTNNVVIDETIVLPCGEAALVQDGQRICFVTHSNVPFLTFRLVSPAMPGNRTPRSVASSRNLGLKALALTGRSLELVEEASSSDPMSELADKEHLAQIDLDQVVFDSDDSRAIPLVPRLSLEKLASGSKAYREQLRENTTETQMGAALLEPRLQADVYTQLSVLNGDQQTSFSPISKLKMRLLVSPARPSPLQPKCDSRKESRFSATSQISPQKPRCGCSLFPRLAIPWRKGGA